MPHQVKRIFVWVFWIFVIYAIFTSPDRAADLVITAEGAVDYQTPRGKVPAEVARRAKRVGVPVIAMAGSIGERADEVHDIGIDAVAGIIPIPMDLAQAVEEASRLVADAAERMMRFVVLGAVIAHRTEQATLETATR